ncbi:hypothetical protein ALTERO38_50750 [Alteromonas sp. 38]|nr:hypothetical protein ALTER154_80515 [Alteromonas sp. 154]VXB46838.1 hypothetical protein ALTERO38_50750 [Alteromonas sp. 38]
MSPHTVCANHSFHNTLNGSLIGLQAVPECGLLIAKNKTFNIDRRA